MHTSYVNVTDVLRGWFATTLREHCRAGKTKTRNKENEMHQGGRCSLSRSRIQQLCFRSLVACLHGIGFADSDELCLQCQKKIGSI